MSTMSDLDVRLQDLSNATTTIFKLSSTTPTPKPTAMARRGRNSTSSTCSAISPETQPTSHWAAT